MAAILDRTADNLAHESAKIMREGFAGPLAFKARWLVPVMAVVASILRVEPLREPITVLRPRVAIITQRLNFPAMPLLDFNLNFFGLGGGNAANSVQKLALAFPILRCDGCAAIRLFLPEVDQFALVPIPFFMQLPREVCAVIFCGDDVVIPSG